MKQLPRLSSRIFIIFCLIPILAWAVSPSSSDATVETFMDVTYTFAAGDFPFSDGDGDTFASVTILTLESAGDLEFNGADVVAPLTIPVASIDLLTFAPDPGASGLGWASFDFEVTDSNAETSSTHTMSIDVITNHDPKLFVDGNEVNDTIALPLAVYEDGSYQFGTDHVLTVSDEDIVDPTDPTYPIIVNIMATKGILDIPGISRFVAGDGTSNVTIVTTIEECNTFLFDIQYIPNPDAVGSETLTFRLNDQGNIGIGGGGDVFRYITFDILPINDAPILDTSVPYNLAIINEDDTTNVGNTIDEFVADGTIYDPDGPAVKSIAVVELNTLNGLWEYSIDDGASWTVISTQVDEVVDISDNALLLDGVDAANVSRIRFVPSLNYVGHAYFSFRAWDMSDITQHSGDRVDINAYGTGGGTPFSTGVGGASIRIAAVNDEPVFSYKSDIIEDWLFVPLQVDANRDYAFTAADSLVVSDPDVGDLQLILNLHVSKGILDFGSRQSRFISGDGTDNVVIVTQLDEMNSYLANFQYISNPDANGLETMTIIMNDQGNTGQGDGVDVTRTLFFALTNDPPVFTSVPADSINEDNNYVYNVVAVDDTVNFGLTLSASTLPAWLTLTDNGDGTGVLEGFADNSNVGPNPVVLLVEDGVADPVEQAFSIEVINLNDPPIVANPIPDQATPEDAPWAFTFAVDTFFDPDIGDILSYTAQLQNGSPLPAWLSFNADTRTFSGTPGTYDVGDHLLAVTAYDLDGENVTDAFTLTVDNTPDPPFVNIPIADTLHEENQLFDWAFPADTFIDPDPGDILTYTAQMQNGDPLASWLNFDGPNRRFTGTPIAAEIGKYYIRVIATDPIGLQTDDVFLLWVTWHNTPPFVVNPIADTNTLEDSPFSYTHAADVFDDHNIVYGDTLSYTAELADDSPLPAWLSYVGNTRTFSGTPLNEDVGVWQVKVTAHDVYDVTVADTFALEVINVNDPPYLANGVHDQNAVEDQFFSYTFPDSTFGDPDVGDILTYTATLADGSPLPGWLDLDSPTRTFAGTPYNNDVGDWLVRLVATDIAGVSVPDTFAIAVENTNDTPFVVNPIPDHTTLEDAAYSFTFVANTFGDSDLVYGDHLSYSALLDDSSPLPAWLSFNGQTRTFSGVSRNEDVGLYSIAVTATDLAAETVSDVFILEVVNTNDAPEVAVPIPDQLAREDNAFDFVFSDSAFVDPDIGDYLTYSANEAGSLALPAWLNFNPAQRRFSGTPDNTHIGYYSIEVTATDNLGESTFDAFIIEVRYLNIAPVVAQAIPDQQADEDAAWSFTFDIGTFTDANIVQGDSLLYTAALADGNALPAWLGYDGQGRTFTGTPTNTDVGAYDIRVTATDRDAASADDVFILNVNNLNDAPYLVNPLSDQTIFEGNPYDYQVPSDTFDDPDLIHGDQLAYSADLDDGSPLPAWLSFDVADRRFTATPTNSDLGDFFIRVTATDDSLASANDVFRLRVSNEPNNPYFVSNPDTSATEDVLWEYHIITNDLDPNSTAILGATLIPSWTTLIDSGNGNGLLYGTPTNDEVGSHPVELFVDDGVRLMGTQNFTIVVANANDAPIVNIPIPDQHVEQDQSLGYNFPPDTFSDIDVGDVLSYSAELNGGSALPPWIVFWGTQRLFVFTPSASEVGTWLIDVTATDLAGGAVTDTFALLVTSVVNQAPYFTSAPVTTALEDELYVYNVTAEDDSINFGLTLAASTLPAWLSFTDNGDGTGLLTGTPTNTEVGDHNVVLTADDDIFTPLTEQAFTISVGNVNSLPYVANPIPDHTTFEDASYAFTFDADTFADPDIGDVFTYTASQSDGSPLPAWLFFNAIPRTFSGIPHNADVGVYSLRVTATDQGNASVFDDFQLEVINLNDDPYLVTPIPDQPAVVDLAFAYTIPAGTFDDPDLIHGDDLFYSATQPGGGDLPAWLSFDDGTQAFNGTPAAGDVGTQQVLVSAADTFGVTATDTFAIEVFPTNAPPVFDSTPAIIATEGALYSYAIVTSDDGIDMGGLALAAPTLPTWLTLIDNGNGTGTLAGTPANDDVGLHAVELTVSDGIAAPVTQSFSIDVANVNSPPVVANPIPDQQAWEDLAYSFTFDANTFTDPDVGDVLTYSAQQSGGSPLPGWLSFDDVLRTFSGMPANADVGVYTIEVTATDIAGADVSDFFLLDVQNAPDAPFFTSTPVEVGTEDTPYIYNITTDDADTGATLNISAPTLPLWLTLTDNGDGTAQLAGTPLNDAVGANAVALTVDDGVRLTDTQSFSIDVANTNDAPYINLPLADQFVMYDTIVSYIFDAASFLDMDIGDVLSYGATMTDGSPLEAWIAFDNVTREFIFTPVLADLGIYSVRVTATDLSTTSVFDDFLVRVSDVANTAPWFTSAPITVAIENQPYSYNVTTDDDAINFGLTIDSTALPAWLTLTDNGNGTALLSGTPLNTDTGNNSVTLTVWDNIPGTPPTEQSFVIFVANVNDAPFFTSTPITDATQDIAYTYSIAVTDDGMQVGGLVISATTQPLWLNFIDNGDGTALLDGTPSNAEVGAHSVVLDVSDGIAAPVPQSFTINVANVNDAPFVAIPLADTTATQDTAFSYVLPAGAFDDIDLAWGDSFTLTAAHTDGSPLPGWLSFDGAGFSGVPLNADIGGYDIRVTATDLAGASADDDFLLTVVNVNDAPYLVNPLPDHSTWAATPYNFVIPPNTFADPDVGDTLSFKANLSDGTLLPAWLEFNAALRMFSGVPDTTDAGIYNIEVTVADTAYAEASDVFQLTVRAEQNPPVVANPIPDQDAYEDVLFDYVFPDSTFVDPDPEDQLAYSARQADGNPLPDWLTFTPTQRRFTCTPTVDEVGSYTILVTATDNFSNIGQDEFVLTVHHSNDLPVFTTTPDTMATQDMPYSYAPAAEDIDVGDSMTLTVPTLPTWLSFVDNGDGTGLLSGAPANADVGDNLVVIAATDSSGVPSNQEFTIVVANLNDPPHVAVPLVDQSTLADSLWNWAFPIDTFDDIDLPWGDNLTYTAALSNGDPLPGWLSFDGLTRTFSGTATNIDVGIDEIEVTATDDSLAAVSDVFLLEVIATQDSPYFVSIPDTSATQDILWSYNVVAEDMNPTDSLTLTATTLPAWLTFIDYTDGTGLLDGTPSNAEVGAHSVVLEVSDGIAAPVLQSFTIDVANVNDAPFVVIPLGDQIAYSDHLWDYTIPAGSFDDIDLIWGDVLAYTAQQSDGSPLPAWFSFGVEAPTTFYGVPTEAEIGGLWDIEVTVTDLAGAFASDTFTLTVDGNVPPVFTSVPVTSVNQDEAYAYHITTYDPDSAQTMVLLVLDIPSWLTLADSGNGNGLLYGTPANADVGDHAVELWVDDGVRRRDAVMQVFDITVANMNDAPYVALPIPDQYTVANDAYSYTIDAGVFIDIDVGDVLTYSAEQSDGSPLPGWLGFDDVARVFSGTPANGDAGSYDLRVTATDIAGATGDDVFTLLVGLGPNVAPLFTSTPALTATEGAPYSYAVTTSDDGIDMGGLVLGSPILPGWLMLTDNGDGTGTLSGTPSNDDVGDNAVELTVSDGIATPVTQGFTITVIDLQSAPYVVTPIPNQSVVVGDAYLYAFPEDTFADDDPGDVLTYAAEQSDGNPLPAWLGFDGLSRTFSGTAALPDVAEFDIRVIATDTATNTANTVFTMQVFSDNIAPSFVSTPVITVTEGDAYLYEVETTDDNNNWNGLVLAAPTLPGWLALTDNGDGAGSLSGNPTNADVGDHAVELTVSDGIAAPVPQNFTITVIDASEPPVVLNPINDQYVYQDDLLDFQFAEDTFFDPDPGDTLSYTAVLWDHQPLPSWLGFTAAERRFTGTPLNADVGRWIVRVEATDLIGNMVYTTFDIVVWNVNDAPTIDLPASFDFAEDTVLVEDFTAYIGDIDPDDALTLSAVGNTDIIVDIVGFVVTFNAPADWNGSETITFTVDDNVTRATATDSTVVSVTFVNDAPYVAIPLADTTAMQDIAFSYILPAGAFDDADLIYGDVLILTAALADGNPLPGWLSFDGAEFSGVPLNADIGVFDTRVTATDLAGDSVYDDFQLTVDNVNDAPTIDLPASFDFAEDTVLAEDFAPYIGDIDPGDVLTLSAVGNTDIIVDIVGFVVTFSAPADWNGSETITFTIDDNVTRATATDSTVVSVTFVNDAPYLAIPLADSTATEDIAYSYILPAGAFDDADLIYGDVLALTAEQVDGNPLPGWLSFDGAEFSGVPLNDDVGSYDIRVTATDLAGDSVYDDFLLTVDNVNDPPTIDLPESFAFAEDTVLVEDFTAYIDDIDPGDVLTLSGGNADIIVDITGFVVTFSAPVDWNGIETITFTVDDNVTRATDSDSTVVSVTFVNDAPYVANPIDPITFDEDTVYSGLDLNNVFDDVDLIYGDVLAFTYSGATNIAVSIDAGIVTLTPDADWFGTETITFTATDNAGVSIDEAVLVTVEDVNDAPTITLPAGFSFDEDADLEVDFSQYITDLEQAYTEMTLTAVGQTEIDVAISGMDVTFTATENWNGEETITFTIDDNQGGRNTVNMRTNRLTASDFTDVGVTFVNDAPFVANGLTDIVMPENTSDNSIDLNVVFGDVDLIYGDELAFTVAGDVNIDVSIVAGVVTLTPDFNWYGTESLTFTATDNAGEIAVDDVVVEVFNVIDIPVIDAIADTMLFAVDSLYTWPVTGYFFPLANFTLTEAPDGMTVIATSDTTGLIEWTPTGDQAGVIDVTVRAENAEGFDEVSFVITLVNQNEMPVMSGCMYPLQPSEPMSMEWVAPANTPWLIGFKLYHSNNHFTGYVEIAEFGVGGTYAYTHEAAVVGQKNFYKMTAMLAADDWSGESDFSPVHIMYPVPHDEFFLLYDDGTAEEGYNADEAGVQFNAPERYIPETVVIKLAIYLWEKADDPLDVYIYSDADPVPGNIEVSDLSYPANELAEGWNFLDIPVSAQPIIMGGTFFVSVNAPAGSHMIGLDTSSTDAEQSWGDLGGGFAPVGGNLMIRAVIATGLPRIAVDTASFNFGDVFAGETSAIESFIVSNVGNTDLDITSLTAPDGFEVRLDPMHP
ncbi:MAG: putative Ig domain-containing protein, partial [Candidatus Cloacimonetes bacterium]|nr:putative Ig domain-containing protein [Candidatus Cloacimonadota bacterium]